MKYETLYKGTTPKVPVFWVKVFEPDTKFVPEGEYSIQVILDEDSKECQDLISLCDELTEKAFALETEDLKPGVLKKWSAKSPYIFLEDEETGEPTGQVKFAFKMKASGESKGKEWTRKCPVFDAQNPPQRINSMEGYIGNGSKGKVAFMVKSYANNKDKEAGIALKLTGFQLIELMGGGDSADDLGFGGEEGGYTNTSTGSDMFDGEEGSAPDAPAGGDF